jgi:uncharacterized protein (DUF1697 family)
MYIAFLRAINVGGHTVKMDALRELFEALGLAAVETFIASGNVIFESRSKSGALERTIEAELQDKLGYEVITFIRTIDEVAAVAAYRPFSKALMDTAGALNVAFLKEPLSATARKKLTTLKSEIDDFHVDGREVYWLCKVKQSESKFSNTLFERALGVRATFRGIGTVRKLTAKYLPK